MYIPEIAYIDAGSGSLIIQGAIASAAAVIVFFRSQIGRVLGRLSGRRAGTGSAETKTTASVDGTAKHG